MSFNDENPPGLSERQAELILAIVKSGTRIQKVTLHPYSGAATVSHRWDRGDTIAIIQQDGRLYSPATEKHERTQAILQEIARTECSGCRQLLRDQI